MPTNTITPPDDANLPVKGAEGVPAQWLGIRSNIAPSMNSATKGQGPAYGLSKEKN